MSQRILGVLLGVAFTVTTLVAGPIPKVAATPVADSDALYELYGRVFPDPHGCVRGQPAKFPWLVRTVKLKGLPSRSRMPSPSLSFHPASASRALARSGSKGNVCATQFIQYPELQSGLQFLQSKFQEFMDVYQVEGESAGLPTTSRERRTSKLYAVRVTDESVTGPKKKFGFSLSIHGIERAGAEGGTRAIEDLVTWARHEPGRGLLDETLGPGGSAVTVGQALRESEIWFFYPNPDGWTRGDVTQGGASYQRYNGNGVDVNRDWPTIGYTFRGYTPASEPEVRAFTDFFSSRKGGWVGTGDLHGMLDANAFTFTMMPAGQLDYARNKAVVGVVRRIQEDANPRLEWYLGIQPGNESGSVPDVAQQWGTVWDTIDYTVTGGLGDWMGTPIGLDAYVAIDNEMWLSHLAPNTVFEPDLEQAHIDGNKGLIYAQIEGAFRESSRSFPLPGKLAYVDHGRRLSHPGSTASTDPHAGLSPQPDITTDVLSPSASGHEGDPLDPVFEFTVLGPESVRHHGDPPRRVRDPRAGRHPAHPRAQGRAEVGRGRVPGRGGVRRAGRGLRPGAPELRRGRVHQLDGHERALPHQRGARPAHGGAAARRGAHPGHHGTAAVPGPVPHRRGRARGGSPLARSGCGRPRPPSAARPRG